MFNSFENIDEVLIAGLEAIDCDGHEVSPRNKLTKEVLFYPFTITNPRARLVCNPARGWSLPVALGEFCWHSSGADDLEAISFYASAWANSSNDGHTIPESCYGKQIFQKINGESVWDKIKFLLESAPQTRRAVVNFNKLDLNFNISTSDVSCTTSCQFLIRNGALDLIVNMRSNDIIWGLPYDVFFFTMLQERMAIELGVHLGRYHHVAGSFHLYEKHFKLAKKVLVQKKFPLSIMKPMGPLTELPIFLNKEKFSRLRLGALNEVKLSEYWQNLYSVMEKYITEKHKGEKLNKDELLKLLLKVSG